MASDEALEEPPDWGDPLDNPLPNAPELNIFCFYGVGTHSHAIFFDACISSSSKVKGNTVAGKQTERSYVLTQDGKSEFGDAGAGKGREGKFSFSETRVRGVMTRGAQVCE